MMKRLKYFLFVLAFTGVFVEAPAHAYLDSGTISLALQGLAGATASVLLFGRAYVQKAVNFVRGSKTAKTDDSQS